MFKWLIKDWWCKLLAVAGAATIWLFSVMEREQTIIISLPVMVKNLPKDLIVTHYSTNSIEVQLKGKVRHLLRIYSSLRNLWVDLKGAKEGDELVEITSKKLNIPTDIEVVSIHPYTIKLKLEKLKNRRVKVTVPFEGFPKKGMALSAIKYDKWVDVYGPQEEIERVTHLFTLPLNIEGKDKSFEVYCHVLPPDTSLGNITFQPESLLVKVEIEPETTIIFSDIGVKLKEEGKGIRAYLLVKKADIEISGPKSRVEKLKKEDIKVVVKVSNIGKGHHRLPAEITTPPALKISCNPPLFDVLVR